MIGAGREDERQIGADGDGGHRAFGIEAADEGRCRVRPVGKPNDAVSAPRHDSPAIGREGQRRRPAVMARKRRRDRAPVEPDHADHRSAVEAPGHGDQTASGVMSAGRNPCQCRLPPQATGLRWLHGPERGLTVLEPTGEVLPISGRGQRRHLRGRRAPATLHCPLPHCPLLGAWHGRHQQHRPVGRADDDPRQRLLRCPRHQAESRQRCRQRREEDRPARIGAAGRIDLHDFQPRPPPIDRFGHRHPLSILRHRRPSVGHHRGDHLLRSAFGKVEHADLIVVPGDDQPPSGESAARHDPERRHRRRRLDHAAERTIGHGRQPDHAVCRCRHQRAIVGKYERRDPIGMAGQLAADGPRGAVPGPHARADGGRHDPAIGRGGHQGGRAPRLSLPSPGVARPAP